MHMIAAFAATLLALVAGNGIAAAGAAAQVSSTAAVDAAGEAAAVDQDRSPIDFEDQPDPVSETIPDPAAAFEPSEGYEVESGVADDPAARPVKGCRTKVAWIGLKNVLGSFLWKYFQKLGWCWKRGAITSATPRCQGTWAEVYFPLWDFKGHLSCDASGGVGQSFVRRWRQGKFQLCAAYCLQTKTPWMNVKGSGTGVFSWSAAM
jgi:hypothetical protein